jgi:AraC-like DNA-binding protein
VTDVPAVVLRPAAGEFPFTLDRRPPRRELAAIVDHFWSVRWELPAGAEHEQHVVSHACGHLTVEGDGGWLRGVVTERFRRVLTGSGFVVGAHLRPGALSALTDLPPATLTDRRLPAADGLGAVDGIDALETWLTARDPHPRPGADLVDAAVDLITTRPDLTRVDALAAALGVTVRTLQRRFDRHLGVGPKWVLRRCRIQDALAVIESGGGVDWAALAVELGFADQPHFTNAFTALVGVPPAAYFRRSTP